MGTIIKQLNPKKPKWRWLLIPLSPIAIAIGFIRGLIIGFSARQSSPVLITGEENVRRKKD